MKNLWCYLHNAYVRQHFMIKRLTTQGYRAKKDVY